MKNQVLIESYFDGLEKGMWAGSLHYSGKTLMSYDAVIAEKDDTQKILYVTGRRYSNTTSRHTNYAVTEARKRGWTVVEKDFEA